MVQFFRSPPSFLLDMKYTNFRSPPNFSEPPFWVSKNLHIPLQYLLPPSLVILNELSLISTNYVSLRSFSSKVPCYLFTDRIPRKLYAERGIGRKGGREAGAARKLIWLMQPMFSCSTNAIADIQHKHLERFSFLEG